MKEKLSNEELFKKGMYDELYEANIRFIYKQAKKFTKLPFEECVSAGNFGFAKAVKTYKPNNNIKFLTYASRIIINEMLMLFRKEKKYFNDISFDGALYTDKEGNQLTLENTLQDDTDIQGDLIHKSDIKALKNAIQLLPKNYADIIQLHLKELNQKQIAEATGLSQSYVSRVLVKAINKLKILMRSDLVSKKEDAFKLFNEGKTNYKEVAKLVETSIGTIHQYKTQWNKVKKEKIQNTPKANIEKDFKEMIEREKVIQKKKIENECITGSGVDEALHFKISEARPKQHILKATKYEGKVMDYNINNDVITINSKENASNINVSKENIDLFIQELTELKEA